MVLSSVVLPGAVGADEAPPPRPAAPAATRPGARARPRRRPRGRRGPPAGYAGASGGRHGAHPRYARITCSSRTTSSGGPSGDLHAVVEHHHAMGQRHHAPPSRAPPRRSPRSSSPWIRRTSCTAAVVSERREAGHGLVEQQQRGRVASARAISRRFLSASVRRGGRHVGLAAEPGELQRARRRAPAPPLTRFVRCSAPHITFSSTVMRPKRPHHLPGARDAEHDRCARGACGDVGAAEARCGLRRDACSRVMQLNSVVLPAPLGPMRPTISPASMVERDVAVGDQAAKALGAPTRGSESGAMATPPPTGGSGETSAPRAATAARSAGTPRSGR